MKPSQAYNHTCGLLWWLIYDPVTLPVSFTDSNINILKAIKLNDTLINALLKAKGHYKSIAQFSAKVDSVMSSQKLGDIHTIIIELRKKNYFVEFYNADYSNAKIIGYAARGYLGQYIDIFPEKKLVVVRTIRSQNYKSASDEFDDFDLMSLNIVR
jgi:hypothetical protein